MVSRLLQFLLFIYAARALGVENYGLFSFAFAFCGLMAVFMDLGISRYLVQQVSRNTEVLGRFLGGAFVVKAGLIIIGLIGILILGPLFHKSDHLLPILIILSGYVALDSMTAPLLASFQAHEKMHYQAVVVMFGNTLMSLAGFVLLYAHPDLVLFCFVIFFGGIIRFFLSAWLVFRRFSPPVWRMDIAFWKMLLKNGAPFALITIFVTIYYYIDTLILTAYSGKAAVAYYNASYRLIEGPLFLVSAFTTALFPTASKLYDMDGAKLNGFVQNAIPKAMLTGLLIFLPLSFFSNQIIVLFYGNEYRQAAAVLPVLALTIGIIMPSTILGTTIRAIGKQNISAWVTGIGAAINIVLNLIVIPYYSFMGAAWTTVFTEMFVLIAYAWLTWRILSVPVKVSSMARVLAIISALAAFLFCTQFLGKWLQLGLYAIMVPVLSIFFGIISLDELKQYFERVLRKGAKANV